MILIDGEEYNATVEMLTRKAEFLDKYAQRTEDGVLQREIIGVYFNYQLTFGYAPPDEYQRLWDKLTEPEEFHTVTVPSPDGDYTFQAYFASVADEMIKKYKGRNYFQNLTVEFIAQSPARS